MSETEPRGVKPLMEWDGSEVVTDEVVWWSKLNGRYQVEVHRNPNDDHDARLYIFDHATEDRLVHDENVELTYGAIFGPDMDDVVSWREKSVAVVGNND